MRFKEKEAFVSYSQNIHIPEGTSVSSNKFTKKKKSESSEVSCFFFVSPLNSSATEAQLSVRCSGRSLA
jgi:hypothetical protein